MPHENLTPEDTQRLAELHLRQRWGETLSAAEVSELASTQETHAAFLAELDAVHAQVGEACRVAQPAPGFPAKVMAALADGRAPRADETLAGPPEVRVFASVPVSRRRWMFVAAGLAASVLVAVLLILAGRSLWKTGPGDTAQGKSHLVYVKGRLLGADGRAVTRIIPGETYRVDGAEGVVAQAAGNGLLRIMPHAQFRAPDEKERPVLRLERGLVYASQTDPQPLVVECPALLAEVQGVTMVIQEAAAETEAQGQALVLVFKGQARIESSLASGPLTVQAGEVYLTGFGFEQHETFLAQAEERARDLESAPANGGRSSAMRRTYEQAVRDYQQSLKDFDRQLAATGDRVALAELRDRRERVQRYLDEHRRRLASLGNASTEEAPLLRAKRLRRAAEEIQEGEDAYTDPDTWL